MADRVSETTDLAYAVLEMLRLGEMNAGAKRDPDLTTATRQQIWVKYRDYRESVKKMAQEIIAAAPGSTEAI